MSQLLHNSWVMSGAVSYDQWVMVSGNIIQPMGDGQWKHCTMLHEPWVMDSTMLYHPWVMGNGSIIQ